MNAFWVCLCLSAYGRPFGACCPRQHTRLTAPLFHTRRSRRLPKRAFSDTLPYHYITPLPTRSSRIPHTTHTSHVPLTTHTHTSLIPHTAPNLHTSRIPLTKLPHTLRAFHSPSSTHTPRPPPSDLKPSDIVLYFTFNSYKVKSYRCRLNSGFLLPAATAAGLFAQTRPGHKLPL